MFLAAEDNSYDRTPQESHFLKYLKTLNKKDQKFLMDLKNSIHFRRQVLKKIVSQEKKMKGMAFSLRECLGDLYAPVSLLHGLDDIVIPPKESVRIANFLKRKISAIICIYQSLFLIAPFP